MVVETVGNNIKNNLESHLNFSINAFIKPRREIPLKAEESIITTWHMGEAMFSEPEKNMSSHFYSFHESSNYKDI